MNTKKLRNKTIVVSSVYFIFLGLALFWPAGTLRYWQAWVYIGILAAVSLVACWHLLRHDPQLLDKRMGKGPWSEPDPIQKYIQLLNGICIMAMYIVSGWDFGAHGPRVSASVSLLANAGLLLSLAGVWVVARKNHFAIATIEVQDGQTVIDSGPYTLVRHPMYSLTGLFLLATPPALGSFWGLVPAALAMVGVVIRLLREEQFLHQELPGYAAYQEKVRYRLLPYVW